LGTLVDNQNQPALQLYRPDKRKKNKTDFLKKISTFDINIGMSQNLPKNYPHNKYLWSFTHEGH